MKKNTIIRLTILLLLVATLTGVLLLPSLVSNDADLTVGTIDPMTGQASEGEDIPVTDTEDKPDEDAGLMSAGVSLPGDEAYADAALTQDAKDAQNADDSAASEENGNTPEPAETKSYLLFGDLPPHPDRVTLREGFFKEPLSDTICKTINGVSYHENDTITYEDLSYLQVLYVDYEKNTRTGELICNKKIADDLLEIFSELYDAGYEICRIRLIDEYGGDDDASCADDNTSCFNYRVVQGTTHLSNHAKGLAIDINPFYNPYVTYPDGKERISPPGSEPYADRSSIGPHMIDENDLCYRLFTEHGFKWGGHWKSLKDYQHFEKSGDS